jgi:two-component system nitrate/nitrite response regulator NarL
MLSVQSRGTPIAVLVDHRDLTRVAMLRAFSEALPGIMVIAVASPADLAGHIAEPFRLAILHIDDPAIAADSARAAIAAAREALGGVPIVTLSERSDETSLAASVDGGASAHLTTSMPLDVVAATLRLVMLGGTSFPPRPISPLAPVQPERGVPPLREAIFRKAAVQPERLTRREEEVLRHIGQGAQNKTIAFMLNMSENTVKVHLHRILQKFRLHNRTELALLADTYFAAAAVEPPSAGDMMS